MTPSKTKRGLKQLQHLEEKPLDELPIGPLPKSYLSFSQVDLYKKCPKAYEYRYVVGEKSPPVPVMIQGKAVHEALELNYDQKIKSKKDLPRANILDKFSDSFDKGMDEISSSITKSDRGVMKDITSKFVWDYQKEYAPQIQPLMVEEKFSYWLTPTIEIKGFIDLVQQLKEPLEPQSMLEKSAALKKEPNRDKVIVDHKVTSRAKSQTDTDNSLQLSIYSTALRIPNVRFDALIPAKPAEVGVGIRPTTSHRVKSDLEFDKSVILSIASSISQGNFPKLAQGTWICTIKFCPHYDKCHGKV